MKNTTNLLVFRVVGKREFFDMGRNWLPSREGLFMADTLDKAIDLALQFWNDLEKRYTNQEWRRIHIIVASVQKWKIDAIGVS